MQSVFSGRGDTMDNYETLARENDAPQGWESGARGWKCPVRAPLAASNLLREMIGSQSTRGPRIAEHCFSSGGTARVTKGTVSMRTVPAERVGLGQRGQIQCAFEASDLLGARAGDCSVPDRVPFRLRERLDGTECGCRTC
eukprot:gene15923-biopygen8208